MSITDYIICGLLIWGFISGFRKGLVMQLAMIVGILAGIWLAVHGSDAAAERLSGYAGIEGRWPKYLGFVLIFAAIYVLAFFGGKSLSAALNLMMLGLINKLAGGIFGVVKFLLILSLVFYFAGSNGWINTDYTHLKDSVMYFSLEGFGKQLYELLR